MKKRTVAILLVVVLALGVTIGGTVAYLMDRTDPVNNTFVAGDIGTLTLAEQAGTEITGGKEFAVIPGTDITKDPKVTYTHKTAQSGDPKIQSVPVYVFVKMDAGSAWAAGSGSTSFTANTTSATPALSFGIDSGWTYLATESGSYVYYRTLAAETDLTAASVISGDKITVSTDIRKGEIAAIENNLGLNFTAYAIQQAGFDTAAVAWAQAKNVPTT